MKRLCLILALLLTFPACGTPPASVETPEAASGSAVSFTDDLGQDFALEPDLVLASVNTAADLELKDTFARAGIPAAYFEVDCFGDYLRMLEVCSRLTGQPERYEICGEGVRAQVNAAIARQDGNVLG